MKHMTTKSIDCEEDPPAMERAEEARKAGVDWDPKLVGVATAEGSRNEDQRPSRRGLRGMVVAD
jgi:hypothetical protein